MQVYDKDLQYNEDIFNVTRSLCYVMVMVMVMVEGVVMDNRCCWKGWTSYLELEESSPKSHDKDDTVLFTSCNFMLMR